MLLSSDRRIDMKGMSRPMMRGFPTGALVSRKTLVLALALASAIALLGCSRGSYPLDFFSEMHYNQSYKTEEPQPPDETYRDSSAPSDSVPVTGRGLQYTMSEARLLVNPAPATAENITAGEKLFKVNCSMCHGQDAKGGDSGPVGPKLAQYGFAKPANLTVTGPIGNKKDGEVFQILSKGYATAYGLPVDRFTMPPMEKLLSEESRWQIIDDLRTLK